VGFLQTRRGGKQSHGPIRLTLKLRDGPQMAEYQGKTRHITHLVIQFEAFGKERGGAFEVAFSLDRFAQKT
jgi:hypothetical protein